jgi:hypothetical protein
MAESFPYLKLPLRKGEAPGDYMERYRLRLSAELERPVTWSEIAKRLGIPVNTVLANKDGRPVQDFGNIYKYATFFGPEILRAYGVSLRQLAYILRQAEDDPEVQAVLDEMEQDAGRRSEAPDNAVRQAA